MYLLAIAWLYVALMMALAEATSTQGSVLGALVTFLLYGLLPLSLTLYLMATPQRRAARRKAERLEQQRLAEAASAQRDDGGHAPAEPLAPVGEEAR
jgi:mannose/fructose/N-acetylgalactosamine-specific phosphotransferase system component IID